ncbi:LexA family transcriptional regulator [Pontibacter sp. G13]|uniref:XRE family transcriptional regulator n=1 Tax=Pontibacter sp. G13 TaxID=3074898 RepID=UPI00288BB5C6|nr:LexA family transcriptional regulator [Pontibacter sp. G13]WNJ17426.1 LexA family transcriptional regulator [Pontibacter sp. G13]
MSKTSTQFGRNLKYLRKQVYHCTQKDFAEFLNVSRANVGSWEEGRCEPTGPKLQNILEATGMSRTQLFDIDLQQQSHSSSNVRPYQGDLPMYDYSDLMKISAGSPIGFFPSVDRQTGEFTALQVEGESMMPAIQPGAVLLCKPMQDIEEIKAGERYVVETNHDGGVLKRVYVHEEDDTLLILSSDNPDKLLFPDYTVEKANINRLWKPVQYILLGLPS